MWLAHPVCFCFYFFLQALVLFCVCTVDLKLSCLIWHSIYASCTPALTQHQKCSNCCNKCAQTKTGQFMRTSLLVFVVCDGCSISNVKNKGEEIIFLSLNLFLLLNTTTFSTLWISSLGPVVFHVSISWKISHKVLPVTLSSKNIFLKQNQQKIKSYVAVSFWIKYSFVIAAANVQA